MTLIRLYDYFEMNFFERLKERGIRNAYYSDDLDDVYKILDCVQNNISFNKKIYSNNSLQSYFILLDDLITIEQTKDSPIFKVKQFNKQNSHGFVITKENYSNIKSKLEKREIKSFGENILLIATVHSSLFNVNSLSPYPLLKDIDVNIPPRRKKRDKKLKEILDKFLIPELKPTFARETISCEQ